jgi:hypothetical protein
MQLRAGIAGRAQQLWIAFQSPGRQEVTRAKMLGRSTVGGRCWAACMYYYYYYGGMVIKVGGLVWQRLSVPSCCAMWQVVSCWGCMRARMRRRSCRRVSSAHGYHLITILAVGGHAYRPHCEFCSSSLFDWSRARLKARDKHDVMQPVAMKGTKRARAAARALGACCCSPLQPLFIRQCSVLRHLQPAQHAVAGTACMQECSSVHMPVSPC